MPLFQRMNIKIMALPWGSAAPSCHSWNEFVSISSFHLGALPLPPTNEYLYRSLILGLCHSSKRLHLSPLHPSLLHLSLQSMRTSFRLQITDLKALQVAERAAPRMRNPSSSTDSCEIVHERKDSSLELSVQATQS